MTSYTSPLVCCIECKQVKSAKGLFTHIERSHGTEEQKSKYSSGKHNSYNKNEYRKKLSKAVEKKYPRKPITTKCEQCGVEFSYLKLEKDKSIKRTCSKSCSTSLSNKERIENGYIQPNIFMSKEKRIEASERTKKLWKEPVYAAKVLATNKRFTSKKEVEIRSYFIEKFPQDQWTFGGTISYKNELMTRDLYSKKLKICFEYDGIWHFKDIHGQLEKKKLKDKLLEEWCILNNYSLLRVSENFYKGKKPKYIEDIIYSLPPGSIIKLGNEYHC